MNRLSQSALMKIVFALIGLIVGLLDYFIKGPLSDSIFKAFIVAAILFIGELVLESRDSQKREKEAYATFVRRNRNLTGTLLTQLNGELERAVKVQESQFIVDHETLAILSYDTFWKLLVEQIETRRKLTVHTIHSCALDVWVEHPLTTSLLNRQRDFCQKGGTIVRILCDRNRVPGEQVQSAARNMAEAGIEVVHYNLASQRITDHNFAWDYALVDETGDAAIWDSFANSPGGVIGEAVYSNHGEYKGKDLRELWQRVRAASTPIPSVTPNEP
ncbi:MAG TPA: hypothetical protein VNO50_19685 [Pyrinomonadaceae bacterium]|nr:hypothetical protein [Pyrinomonadaceae bacterium]